ncbi:MAG: hypothetical protein RLZZ577_71 [Bacteroidota bacterium]|jgi:hypothetical protein
MDKVETLAILNVIKISYPYFYKDLKDSEAENMLNVWAMMFENDNARIVVEAVKAVITSSKYPPNIADIKEKITLLTKDEGLTEMEAWGIVYKAICSSGYNSIENFEKLPVTLQKIIGSAKQLKEWAITENLNIQVVQSNFMRSYKVMQERNNLINKLPESCKNMINKGVDQLCLDVLNVTEKDL